MTLACNTGQQDMRALHGAAEAAGVQILCEMGLDPGMDHMSAMKIIDEVRTARAACSMVSSVHAPIARAACSMAASVHTMSTTSAAHFPRHSMCAWWLHGGYMAW